MATVTGPTLATLRVYGQPGPQGSKRHVGGGRMIESSAKVKPWRQDVAAAATDWIEDWPHYSPWLPLDGPLQADMVFSLTRPRSHYRTGRNAHLLRDTAPVRPISPPDLSKLARSTEDALETAGLIVNDARIASYGRLDKVWCREDPDALDRPGALIRIRLITKEGQQ